MRFTMTCMASHGHQMMETADGSWMLYADHEARWRNC
jgi:hypothetical protein